MSSGYVDSSYYQPNQQSQQRPLRIHVHNMVMTLT